MLYSECIDMEEFCLSDFLTEEEIEDMRQQKSNEYNNAPISSESLGLWDRDFM